MTFKFFDKQNCRDVSMWYKQIKVRGQCAKAL